MQMADAYVFDLDGTLATIPVDWGRVKVELREITGTQEEFRSVFPTIVGIIAKDPRMQRRVFELIDRYEVAAVPMASLYEGTLEVLSKLSERSLLSLVTMQGERACSMLLERFELKQYFVRSYTREDSLDRAEQVRLALDEMKADRSSSMFVGDRLNDLNAARKVGVPFTMIRTHGEDPDEADVPVYHSTAEFLESFNAPPA